MFSDALSQIIQPRDSMGAIPVIRPYRLGAYYMILAVRMVCTFIYGHNPDA